jgi:hypothetical protein
MAQTQRRPAGMNPFSMLVGGMRRMASMDLDDVTTAMQQFSNPDANFLDMLGRDREERVEKMAELLKGCTEEDMQEMASIFGEAMARNEAEKARQAARQERRSQRDITPMGSERPQRRPRAAERREERRRAS